MSTTNTIYVYDAIVTIVNPTKSVITLSPQNITVIQTSDETSYDLTTGADLILDVANTRLRVMSTVFNGGLKNLIVGPKKPYTTKRRVSGDSE